MMLLVLVLSALSVSVVLAYRGMPARHIKSSATQRNCVGTVLTPVEQGDARNRRDADESWKTPTTSVIPYEIIKESLTRPTLITFSQDTLIEPSQSIGRWYREALNTVCDMQIRLPRPEFFSDAFNVAYAEMNAKEPCFGAKSGMTSRDWWFAVVSQTYKTTKLVGNIIDNEEMDILLPGVFEMLYEEVFNTAEGWVVKEDVIYTLEKLVAWRDQGSGPKLGVLANSDERLKDLLGELEIDQFFDAVLTTRGCGAALSDKALFDAALTATGSTAAASYHIGSAVGDDVTGAATAGWTPVRINTWFDEDFPDWHAIEAESEADSGAASRKQLLQWGRRDLARPASGSAASTGSDSKRLEWIELWGLDDILFIFGFPDDPTKPIKTTYIKNVLDDN